MKLTLKKSLLVLFLVAGSVGILSLTACGEDEDCSGCPSGSPWGQSGSSSCYSSQSACESDLGGTCYQCN